METVALPKTATLLITDGNATVAVDGTTRMALGSFLVHLAEAVWDWGMALAGTVGEAAQGTINEPARRRS